MKSKTKKLFLVISLLIAAAFSCGCTGSFFPRAAEINRLDVVRGAAFDMMPDGKIRVTLLISSSGEDSDDGGSSEKSGFVFGDGNSVSAAISSIQQGRFKRLFMGQCGFYVFGEELMRGGLRAVTDYLTRERETRGAAKVFAAKETAHELIVEAAEKGADLPEHIRGFADTADTLEIKSGVTLTSFVADSNGSSRCAAIPFLFLPVETEKETAEKDNPESGSNEIAENDAAATGSGEEKDSGDETNRELHLGGMCVLREEKLVFFIEKIEARGQSFLLGHGGGFLQTETSGGGKASAEIQSAVPKIKPAFSNDLLTGVTLKLMLTLRLRETGNGTVDAEEEKELLKQNFAKDVKKGIEDLCEKAKENSADCLRIAESLQVFHPAAWRKLEPEWSKHFSNLPVNVVVEIEMFSAEER